MDEEKVNKVLGYDVDLRLDKVNKPMELKLDVQRNIQTKPSLHDESQNDKVKFDKEKHCTVFFFW